MKLQTVLSDDRTILPEGILRRILSTDSARLPTCAEILEEIIVDDWNSIKRPDMKDWINQDRYRHRCFPLLTEQFVQNIICLVKAEHLEPVIEVACGLGWLAYWLQRYGLTLEASDNQSWKFPWKECHPFVAKADAVEKVQSRPDARFIILSWPYMDALAFTVWQRMQPGQWMLYIGEGDGGCNADEDFFKATQGHEVEDQWGIDASYLPFWGLHDRPYLFRKEEER